MSRPYPIVEYAHMIGKSTADFTMGDFVKYMKWWMKQPQRKDLITVTPEQRKVYEKDVRSVQNYFKKYPEKAKATREFIAACESKRKPKGENNMKITSKSKMQPIQEVEEMEEEMGFEDMDNQEEVVETDEEEASGEEEVVETNEVEEETVANIELTRQDVDALLWGINQLFEDYDLNEHEMGPTLASLKEVLEGIE